MLLVGQVAGKGKCVFTDAPIRDGDPVATEFVILIPKEVFDVAGPPLSDYPLGWDDTHHCIVCGLITFVNHGDEPNSRVERDTNNLVLRLVAMRDIEPGEEITYDYRVPLWFQSKPAARLMLEKPNGLS
jgi:hypothetical protein